MLYIQMAIPSISDWQPDRKPVSSELHETILAKVQKGYKLLLKKIKSAFPLKMHIYTLCPERFQWMCADRLFRVVSFILVKFLSSKRGITSRKKWNQNFLWICTSTHYVLHNYKVSGNSVKRFQRNCANKLCWVVSFILAKFLSLKRA